MFHPLGILDTMVTLVGASIFIQVSRLQALHAGGEDVKRCRRSDGVLHLRSSACACVSEKQQACSLALEYLAITVRGRVMTLHVSQQEKCRTEHTDPVLTLHGCLEEH